MNFNLLWRRFRQGVVAVTLACVVLLAGQGYYPPDAFQRAIVPYRYSLVGWETGNFLDKWLRRLEAALPWRENPTHEQRLALVEEYFSLEQQEQALMRQLLFPQAAQGSVAPDPQPGLTEVKARRRQLQPVVEETLEAEVSAALAQQGFAGRVGLIFPPVDAVYATPPAVLVTSPRDRIARDKSLLLKPGLDDLARQEIEAKVEAADGVSALVESTGGVALYPSVVSDEYGLAFALETTAHEWLHQYFFFRPLGQHMWDSPEMNTLNETAATLGGQLLGDLAYAAVTGKAVTRDPAQSSPPPPPDRFDFNAFLRETRLKVDDLLARGEVAEAEAYMEQRRQELVARGYLIRKLNQAYFAFHGTYATSGASSSPIGDQMRELWRRSDSPGEFIRAVAQFGSYQEFLDYLEQPAP